MIFHQLNAQTKNILLSSEYYVIELANFSNAMKFDVRKIIKKGLVTDEMIHDISLLLKKPIKDLCQK